MSAVEPSISLRTRTEARGSQLMLVSAMADSRLRSEVRQERRPMPEYLLLERDYGVELFDWSRLGGRGHRRSLPHSLRHLSALGLGRLRDTDTLFSDGEHIGIPVAMIKQALQVETPHVMIGHRLTAPLKRSLVRVSAGRGISRIVVHSTSQLEGARSIGIHSSKLAVIPYGIDTAFWSPRPGNEEALILSPGREHRDHRTLASACRSSAAQVVITGASAHSPHARRTRPAEWTGTMEERAVDYLELRRLYGTAKVVVIPLLPVDFPAGVTTLLEAMAMGKAIVVTATAGLRDYVIDGETALLTPPGDAGAIEAAINRLLADPVERLELGRRAHQAAVARFGLSLYSTRLMGLLFEAQADAAAVP